MKKLLSLFILLCSLAGITPSVAEDITRPGNTVQLTEADKEKEKDREDKSDEEPDCN